mgnify:CR=1 FL=1
MRKKIVILTTLMLLGVASLWARPGYSRPVDVAQPDGTTVTLLMHGDEFLSYTTTTDGYTVVKCADGYYRYAVQSGGRLRATDVVARNAGDRSAADADFVAGLDRRARPEMGEESRRLRDMALAMRSPAYEAEKTAEARRAASIWSLIDYNNFKGLVILVNWNDRKFTMDNPQEFYQRLTSEKDYRDDSRTIYPVAVSGSTRDYFYDNSMGMFDPTFDVVGPIDIDYSCEYPNPRDENGNETQGYFSRVLNIIKAVMNKVNPDVDFANYDLNSDGKIDMVYLLFAGYGSYVQGNSHKYTWPHANDFSSYATMYGMTYDGKRFGRYACGVEIQDLESQSASHVWLDGIGTMCHEFSHVLGLADHYDADYEESGQADDPGQWDIMAAGTDLNYGLTPVGYNAFERELLGFCEPAVVTGEGSYALEPFNTSNQALVVTSAKTNEDFYLENRQRQGWDTYLPGHGLLVWRADTSKPSVWRSNIVNIDPSNMCFELLGNAPVATRDLVPEVCAQWGSKGAAINLYDITETGQQVSFEAGAGLYPYYVEDFEDMELTTADATGVAGKMCRWDLRNAVVTETSGDYGSGQKMVRLNRNGTLTTSTLSSELRYMSVTVQNGDQKVRIGVKYSTDNGATWNTALSNKEIAKGKSASIEVSDLPAGSQIQLSMLATSNSAACYVDDIVISTSAEEASAVAAALRDSETADKAAYNLSGQRVTDSYRGLVVRGGRKYVMGRQ